MAVTVKEILKVRDVRGKEHEGVALIGELIAVETDNGIRYGLPVERVRIETKIECDAGTECENSEVGDDFVTRPRVIEFTENGATQNPEFVKTLAEVIITQDYRGEKKAFCTQSCAANYIRRKSREEKVVQFPSGKGTRTFNEPTEVK